MSNKKKDENEHNSDITLDTWKVISTFGKGVVKGIQWIGNAPENIGNMITDGVYSLRDRMAITEIVVVFNTTDHDIQVLNREAPHDDKEIAAMRAVSMATATTRGAFIPWYDPPNKLRDFSRRHIEIVLDDQPVFYVWQRGNYVYWCNQLNSRGEPDKSYKMTGSAEVGGRRMMVFRYDPDFGYSAFLSDVSDSEDHLI